MKLVLGIVFGVVGMWLYRSEQARQRGRRALSATPEPLRQAGQTVATTASSAAQRMAGVIDAAPLPAKVKDVAARVTGGTAAQGAGRQPEPHASDYIGTPGVESAGGRERTAPGGDLPPDLARP